MSQLKLLQFETLQLCQLNVLNLRQIGSENVNNLSCTKQEHPMFQNYSPILGFCEMNVGKTQVILQNLSYLLGHRPTAINREIAIRPIEFLSLR